MRILHVISDLDPAAGGPPMVVSRLAAAQAHAGHEVHLVVYDTPAVNDQIDADLRSIPGGSQLILHRVSEPGWIEWIFCPAARREMERLAPRVDVFHIHGIWDPILLTASKVARAFKKPYVLAPHGMLDVWAMSEKSLKKKIAMNLGYRSMVRHAAFLHAHSEYECKCIRESGLNQHAEVISNGVFLDEFTPLPPKGTFYASHPELLNQPYVLFLARLHEVKGLDLLADAFAKVLVDLPTIRLVIAGPDFGAKAALVEQVKRLGIADRVHFVGPKYGKEKIAAYADAACFALPSKHESFGMSVAEAMACRVAVVITESCNFPDVARVRAGRVVPRRVEEIASALREVLSDTPLRLEMGQAGRALIEDKFTWPRVAQRSGELYENLINSNSESQNSR